MKILIDISEEDYKTITEDYISYADTESGRVYKAIKEGTVLPAHHGRLIDADELKKDYPQDEDWEYPVNTNSYVVESIDNAPTILEATEDVK